ncbi:hypothetical protein [Chitinophaga eiseniae]|nr:hypothetical protein [Chitinophaga eiseniae]
MATADLVLKFENTNKAPLVLIIGPPCIDYFLETGEFLKLKIIGYKDAHQDVNDIIDVRYTVQDTIHIDINYSFRIVVERNGEEEIIW